MTISHWLAKAERQKATSIKGWRLYFMFDVLSCIKWVEFLQEVGPVGAQRTTTGVRKLVVVSTSRRP